MNVILLIFCGILTVHGFLLDNIPMTPDQVDRCSTCDARANRECNHVVGNALRDYMTKNQVKLAIESGDVVVTQNLPTQKIDTGHSCSKTAEARDGKITAKMVGTSEELDSLYINYTAESIPNLGFIRNTIIYGAVPHEVNLNADIRVTIGVKFFGSCKRVGRKTCSIEGSSTGYNNIEVNLALSECSVAMISGQEYLQFLLDVTVLDATDASSYKPLTIPKGKDCDILGLVSINSYIKKYGDSFLGQNTDKITELRGSKLVQKLETILKAELNSTITVKATVNADGGGRKKRSTAIGCKPMKCQSGFSRIGNTNKCQKFMGSRSTDCSQYGRTSTVYARRFGRWTFYWCLTDMVPV